MDIYIKRQPPQELFVLQRLLMRLPDNHAKTQWVQKKIYQLSAGYSGEIEVDRLLPEIGLPKECSIIKGLRIEVLPNFFIQIDTLLITRKSIILLEVKNYSGTVQFDEASGKTIKTSPSGEVEKFDCVVHQVDRAVHGLKTILRDWQIPLPILPIIVMANQRTEIFLYPKAFPVKYGKQLPKYIRGLVASQDCITQQEMMKISNYLKSLHTPLKHIPACERYTISPSELLTGVLCPHCNHIMRRKQGRTWTCAKCQLIRPEAVEEAVADWFYLISETLTNKQLRHFLEINSNTAASLILRQLQLNRHGATSNLTYTWDYQNPIRRPT